MNKSSTEKIQTRSELHALRNSFREKGQIVGFTSGVFDLLHAGHVAYLEEAKSHCDILIVGINSDVSVRVLKGPLRPICDEEQRTRVVAGLQSVDYIFCFDEQNNNQNITELKPDRYIKAGDYSKDRLSSAAIIEEYGGEVVLVQFEAGLSSTNVIETITNRYAPAGLAPDEELARPPCPAAFIDRDGTIIKHVEYLSDPEQVVVYPEAITGMKRLQDAGYRLVIVTNQAGIGLGYFSREDFFRVNRRMLKSLSEAGILIDKIYYSPASKADGSPYRKPATGMIRRAVEELNIDVSRSVVFGDSTADIALAVNAGCASVLVKTGNAGKDSLYDATADYEADDFLSGTDWFLGKSAAQSATETLAHRPAADELELLTTLGSFSGKLGHDLNNLLASIQGCTDLIQSRAQRAYGDELPFGRQIAMQRKSIDKGKELTAYLRGFIRKNELPKEDCVLKDLIDAALQEAQKAAIPQSSIQVALSCDENTHITANSFQITWALTRLLTNALEAASGAASPSVRISASPSTSNQGAILRIENNGSIPSKEQLNQIFQLFRSTKSDRVGRGFGLTLPMVSAIMYRLGGQLKIAVTEDNFFRVELWFTAP